VSSVILGARTREQLADNLAAADWEPTGDELSRLDDVSAPPTPDYPYGFIAAAAAGRRESLS
jgi:aryl-alcohol dehydrogenase (NADP+)